MEKIYKSVEVPTGLDLKLHKDLLMTDDYHSYPHNCETMKEKRALKAKSILEETYANAEKISVTEAMQKFDYLYIEELDECYDVNNYSMSELKHLSSIYHIFGTKQVHMTLDADWIIENACEDLCEGAYDYIGDTDIDKLQKLISKSSILIL